MLTKQKKVAEPAVYYTTANLASSKSISIKSVIPYELAQRFKIKNGDIIFWQKTDDNRMLVWKKRLREKIPENAKESGKERKKIVSGTGVKNGTPSKPAPPKPAAVNTTEGSQPQISNTTTV